jgi:DNA mismatch repair protein MutS2
MLFSPGDPVHVAALGKGIVREVRNAGRYLVEIKGTSIVVAAAQLAPVEPRRSKRGAKRSVAAAQVDAATGDASAVAPRSLDLHGKTVDEALDAMDAFLNDALLEGAARVRIVHGRSGGRIKAAVHARLKRNPSIRGFQLDPTNHGVTIVTL